MGRRARGKRSIGLIGPFAIAACCAGLISGCAAFKSTTEKTLAPVAPGAVAILRGQNPPEPDAPPLPPLPNPTVAAPVEAERIDPMRGAMTAPEVAAAPEEYPIDPMRGGITAPSPASGSNRTLRELLGLGRPDFADDPDDEPLPPFPKCKDDPLAKADVPPERKARPLFPAGSNLIAEHTWDLLDDPAEARQERLRRRAQYDISNPGPDTANFPNSAFTLPQGRIYIETSPVSLIGKRSGSNGQYNWEFLYRYGITDNVEFRLFSNGYTVSRTPQGTTTGFAPIAFDLKIHLWDENREHWLPAAGLETYIQTPFGSKAFDRGTQPSLALNLDHSLPFDVVLEHNFGMFGHLERNGSNGYTFAYQWSLQRQVFRDFALFTHGFLNSSALPRFPESRRHLTGHEKSVVVVGGGFEWNLSRRFAVFGSYNAGVTHITANSILLLGCAVAL